MNETYKIADHVFSIDSVYPDVHKYCEDYRYDGEPEFIICTTPADIKFERERYAKAADLESGIVYASSDGYLEELAVYRKLAVQMLCYDTFLFHGSCVSVDANGYLFTASSGTGKSTHTRLWRELLGERAVMVNDDKPLIRVYKGGAVIFGTPYNGKHRLGSNISVPLKAVILLERSEKNTIVQISPEIAYPKLIQQTYRPSQPEQMEKTMLLLDRLTEAVKLYRLGCNMDITAAEIAYNALR